MREFEGFLIRRFIEVHHNGAIGWQINLRLTDDEGAPRRRRGRAFTHGDFRSLGFGTGRAGGLVAHILSLERPLRGGILGKGHHAVVIQVCLADGHGGAALILECQRTHVHGVREALHRHLLGNGLVAALMHTGNGARRKYKLGIFVVDGICTFALGKQVAESHTGLICTHLQSDSDTIAGERDRCLVIVITILALLTHHRLPGGVAAAAGDLPHGEAVLELPKAGGKSQLGGLHQGLTAIGDLVVGNAILQPHGNGRPRSFRRTDRHRISAHCHGGRNGRNRQHNGQQKCRKTKPSFFHVSFSSLFRPQSVILALFQDNLFHYCIRLLNYQWAGRTNFEISFCVSIQIIISYRIYPCVSLLKFTRFNHISYSK